MAENSSENKKRIINAILAVAFGFIVAISLKTLVTAPRLWVDEGKTIELARNFLNFGRLDIETSPGQFSGIAPSLQSTGYPVAIPLAIFFKIFGLGTERARIFMLIWLVVALKAVFLVAKKIFNSDTEALLSFLLIASFASFYDSGRTVVGEIPGFLFLLIGLYYWLEKENYYATGMIWGLAVVTKPSVFGLIIPAITLVFFANVLYHFRRNQAVISKVWPSRVSTSIHRIADMGEGDPRTLEITVWWSLIKNTITNLIKIAAAMIPAAILWFLVVIKEPPLKALAEIGKFYNNPYSSSISQNIITNIKNLPHQTTIIYFTLLSVLILTARYLIRKQEGSIKKLYDFIIIYSIFAFIYYLRSPGWLRYILIAELLILFILPNALKIIFENIKKIPAHKVSKAIIIVCSSLVLVQTIQMFTISKIYSSDDVPNIISYINTNFPNSSVATIQLIEAHTFLQTEKRFMTLNLTGMPQIGADPLTLTPLSEILIAKTGIITDLKDQKVLASKYKLLKTFGDYNIYNLTPHP